MLRAGVGNHTSAMGANARVLSLALPPNMLSSVNGHLIQVCECGPWLSGRGGGVQQSSNVGVTMWVGQVSG